MTETMNQTQELYRRVFGTANEATVLVDGTSRAGIEAALVSLLAPGDSVLVPVFGRFGHLLAEIAGRAGATVHTIETEWGQVFPASVIEDAIIRVRPKLLAVVQGDTSTTMNQPLDELGAICERHGVLFYTDVTASVGGNPLEVDAWGIDAVSAGLQKCLGGPSGSAPLSLSPRAVAVLDGRRSVEAGIREPGDEVSDHPIQSNYLDLAMIIDYWGAPAPQPPHRSGLDALRGERVRPDPARGRPRRRGRTARPRRPRDARGCPRPRSHGVRGRRPQDAQRRRGGDPRRGPGGTRSAPRCSRTTASRSARRSARCTDGCGASGRWATTHGRTPS
ncbi:alanine--glyoxylate aminotransferase family protein [Curtobacterium sp. MCPF17_052]|uniref:pyridoxal-phosphate-dependent aminotransferase family protein n=1 Tax=Curtobacterium sp. MCPF17_052 TaxID=2175655 RepID=UPI0024DFA35B|nr:aminotransferase class V-fold PLP-dependent enzyme [Curtobacterium sp. MCPF17_052]WIB13179.1 aminotransferase class V-fold PLP-dependent enzyme [Curtobacterium sp. MCPF17_052]